MQEKDMKKACDKNCTTCRHEDREYDESPCVDCIRGDGDEEMWQKKENQIVCKNCSNCAHKGTAPNMFPCSHCRHCYVATLPEKRTLDSLWEPQNEKPEQPQIKDSGFRREFESGAVRDICEGKGRCDLLPLDVIGSVMNDSVIAEISNFVFTRQTFYLFKAIKAASEKMWKSESDMVLDLAKHFEEGAKKYGERNWEKGLPVHCYIDSAVRHYLKWLQGDKDEPHDSAFVWNLVCCIWTMWHRPDLDDLPKKEEPHESVSE